MANSTTGAVSGYATRKPVATNFVTAVLTNLVPVFFTNPGQVPVTNLAAKPEVEATIQAGGSIVSGTWGALYPARCQLVDWEDEKSSSSQFQCEF